MTKTIVQLYADNPIVTDAGNILEITEHTGTTPVSGAIKASSLMFNRYKITPTVASNDLVLTLHHEDGTSASADRPLFFKINNSLRACTAALAVTKADATNWANLGSAELATKEADLFAYVVWNTNLAPDAVDIFWSRIPNGRLYSNFSSTTTNEKYAAINATAPAATDECVCIGRFAATLSAGAGYTWTVPAFTNANLIQHPIFETRWLDWQPVYSASGSLTYTSVSTGLAKYKVKDSFLMYEIAINGTLGGSASTVLYATLPFEATQIANTPVPGAGNTATVTAKVNLAAGTPDLLGFAKYDNSNYATSGSCSVSSTGLYEI